MAAEKQDSGVDDADFTEEELEHLCVLAGSDPENCSYSQGYVKRQALFACNTCTPGAAQPAGVCLACANKCHDGHDIFELYTKRNFRCDCGNGKFGEFKCQLNPAKDQENNGNRYNHNFSGCYCTCDRPYPDTDDQVQDEMIQCIICEDWFHSRHLGSAVAEPEELEEMVCEACMNKAPFLWTYAAHFAVTPVIKDSRKEEERDVTVDVEKENCGETESRNEETTTSAEHASQEEERKRSVPHKRTHKEVAGTPLKATTKSKPCTLNELQAQGLERLRQGAVFWPYSWRSQLCTCTNCKRAYVAADVPFLMDLSDTVLAYEKRGFNEPFGQHPLLALTSTMDRAQQLEVIYGFKELTTSINAFLERCISEGKTVTVEAVDELMEELQARKKRRANTEDQ